MPGYLGLKWLESELLLGKTTSYSVPNAYLLGEAPPYIYESL
jgi:hypothetical protein